MITKKKISNLIFCVLERGNNYCALTLLFRSTNQIAGLNSVFWLAHTLATKQSRSQNTNAACVYNRERGCTARAGGGASSKQCYHEYVSEEKGLDSLAELAYFVLHCFTTSRYKTGKYICVLSASCVWLLLWRHKQVTWLIKSIILREMVHVQQCSFPKIAYKLFHNGGVDPGSFCIFW